MSARPWMKFYPADWQSDEALRTCSLASRGAWIELLALMHKAVPRGHLLVAGRAPTERQLSILCGAAEKEMRGALVELEGAGVFDRQDGVIVSRRMVRDTEKAERDKANGKGGGNPSLIQGVNPPDNPDDNGGDKAQKLEARDQKLKEEKNGGSSSRSRPKRAIPADWAPSETDVAYAAKEGFTSAQTAHMAERFANHARQQDRRCAAWEQAWRNWVLEERKRNPIKPKRQTVW